MIIIIDNYDGFVHSLRELTDQTGMETHLFRNDKITVEAIHELHPQGLIISSGAGLPKDSGVCFELIRDFSSKIPILGVDLGFHIIAECFGAKTVSIPPIHALPCLTIHRGGDLYHTIASPFVTGQYHSHILDKRTSPSILISEAEKDDGTVMSIKHAQYPCYGVLYHPESMLTPEGQKIISNFCALCKKQEKK